jgi:tripartite-type tricarboxylate transporter receptor subunit TctC
MSAHWRRWVPVAAVLVLDLPTPPPAAAQDYPSRQVTIVVPFAAGGGTDILARMLAAQLEQRLGRSFVIDNKPGAGTVIGANLVAKAPPDGHTLLMATSTPMAINVTLHKSLPYDPAADLVPLALVAQVPFVLIVNPSLPVQSVPDLIRLAKERPGQLSFGSGGPGAAHHLYGELLKSMTGIEMTHVPYRGSLPALNDVVAGHISLMFCDFAPAAEMLKANRVRALGVSTRSRVTNYEHIPPIAEAGVPGFEAAAWQMLVAPSGTPRPVVTRLHNELKAVLALPEVKEQIVKLGLLSMDNPSVEGLQEFVKSEIVRWGAVVRQAGIAGSE